MFVFLVSLIPSLFSSTSSTIHLYLVVSSLPLSKWYPCYQPVRILTANILYISQCFYSMYPYTVHSSLPTVQYISEI